MRLAFGVRKSVRYRQIATVAALACVLLGVAACGGTQSTVHRVSVLPSAAARGQSWEWTSACTYGPHDASGCAAAGPVLGSSQLAGNEWNLGGDQAGGEAMTMAGNSTGGLRLSANLTNAPPCTGAGCLTNQANTWVRGFPSVLYGIDQCHAATSPAQSPQLRLPGRVDSIPADLVGSTAYDARAAQVTHDVAYDLWLSPSSTATPCQHDGTVEVMVWTEYDAQSLLPDDLRVGTATIPMTSNGSAGGGTQTWSVYASNVFNAGHTQPWGGTIWLIPNASDTTQHGTVSVDLSAALGAAGSVLQNVYGWTAFANSYWLDTIAFGIEYGPGDADPYGSGPADFSLDLSSYCLTTGTTVAAAAC